MLDKNNFFDKYSIKETFEKSGLQWETLEAIYDDYVSLEKDLKRCCVGLEKILSDNFQNPFQSNSETANGFHSIQGRIKSPEHLIEKIIRKRGKEHSSKYKEINVSNYKSIVRDLIGIRILVLAKEEWEYAFDKIVEIFPEQENAPIKMAEPPKAYTRYGDRDIFKGKIRSEHSNKGYRSQHYVVWFCDFYCEIQVRTLSEEVYGEFDHKVKYPYRENNKFLIRYTNTLSQLLDAVDELISTCFQLKTSGWEYCDKSFGNDKYIDWKNISLESKQKNTNIEAIVKVGNDKIDVKESAKNIFLRRGRV